MKAEILSVGTELLMGELVDTNSSWIAGKLPALGIQLCWVSIIGDDLDMLADAFARGMQRSDIIFTTGGLGPTQDDLTREAVAKTLGETPTVQEEVVRELQVYFQNRGTRMPAHNIKQAHLIPSARFIPNRNGTAPGWWTEKDGRIIVSMPGPPAELHSIWDEEVEPRLREIVDDEVTIKRNIKTMGLSESAIDEIISEFFGQENPYLGIYSKADGIHLRIIARAAAGVRRAGYDCPGGARNSQPVGPIRLGVRRRNAGTVGGAGASIAGADPGGDGVLHRRLPDQRHHRVPRSGPSLQGRDRRIRRRVPGSVRHTTNSAGQPRRGQPGSGQRYGRLGIGPTGADYGVGVTGAPGPGELEGRPLGLAYIAIARATAAGPQIIREMEVRVPPRRVTIKRRISNTALIELRKLIGDAASGTEIPPGGLL